MTAESRGRHSPTRLDTYLAVHHTRMRQFLVEQFVLFDGLEITPIEGAILMEGTIDCLGGIRIDVEKRIAILNEDGMDSLVQTESYSYNVSVQNLGNVFRYDSPHISHNRFHHKHTYDPFSEENEERIDRIHHSEETPTLSDVISEAREWYYDNLDGIE